MNNSGQLQKERESYEMQQYRNITSSRIREVWAGELSVAAVSAAGVLT
ncbi:MAG: hypothetical protein NTZ51_09260 [Proteobacteria bacterium]|nr:hypothetical protein [Pseudomonadota bacterium]